MASSGDPGLTEADKQRCPLRFRYRKAGVNQWVRIGRPDVDIDHPGNFGAPVITEVSAKRVDVRLLDISAIDFRRRDLLGDSDDALEACDEALLARFPGDVIVDYLSDY